MRFPPALAAALDMAPIPQPFTLSAYLAEIRRIRGRRLHMHDLPAEAAGAVCGLWIATRKADHIFVAAGAAGVLRVNIVLHEVSHMLLDHGKVGGDAEEALRRLLWPVAEVVGGAGRARYDTVEEREAERLATMILLRANQPPANDRDGLGWLARTFGYTIRGGHR